MNTLIVNEENFRSKSDNTVAVGMRYNGIYKLSMNVIIFESAAVKNDILQL